MNTKYFKVILSTGLVVSNLSGKLPEGVTMAVHEKGCLAVFIRTSGGHNLAIKKEGEKFVILGNIPQEFAPTLLKIS